MTRRTFQRLILVAVGLLPAGCQSPATNSDLHEAAPPARQIELSPVERRKYYATAYERGLRSAETADYRIAADYFQKALSVDPESKEARLGLGACLESMGDPARAIREYRRVLEADPTCADAYANLGTAYIKLYHRERNPAWRNRAREAWTRSLELRPGQSDLQTYLASTERR